MVCPAYHTDTVSVIYSTLNLILFQQDDAKITLLKALIIG